MMLIFYIFREFAYMSKLTIFCSLIIQPHSGAEVTLANITVVVYSMQPLNTY